MNESLDRPALTQARILLVDDEAEVRAPLARALNLMGYQADEAESGPQAQAMLAGAPYDVAVVDIRMPGMDGIEVLRWVRQNCPSVAVILLTGHATKENAIAGVKLHADDYLQKPISIAELAESVNAALTQRRSAGPSPTRPADRRLTVGPVALDRDQQIAFVSTGTGDETVSIRLTLAEAKLLSCLMSHAGAAVSCRELSAVLGHRHVSDLEAQNVVRPHVSRLRRKIEGKSEARRLIHTTRDGGYIFRPQSG